MEQTFSIFQLKNSGRVSGFVFVSSPRHEAGSLPGPLRVSVFIFLSNIIK